MRIVLIIIGVILGCVLGLSVLFVFQAVFFALFTPSNPNQKSLVNLVILASPMVSFFGCGVVGGLVAGRLTNRKPPSATVSSPDSHKTGDELIAEAAK